MADDTKDPCLHVYTENSKNIDKLDVFAAFFDKVSSLGISAVVITAKADEATKRQLAKRSHDLKAALRTMGFTLKALESGYKFDDDKARAKIDAIARALQVLERETTLMGRVLFPE